MFDASVSPISVDYCPHNRHTYIRISNQGEIKVRTPLKNESAIRRILKLRENWIREKLTTIHLSENTNPVLGETIRFRGENQPLELIPAVFKKIEKRKNTIDIEKYYSLFYKNEAHLTLPSRISHYARKMDLHPKEIRFKKMRRRWGSCSSTGIVTLNTMMMQLSYEHIDYIIVHELAHLRHMNHSKEFHSLVAKYLENEKHLRRELREIHPVL